MGLRLTRTSNNSSSSEDTRYITPSGNQRSDTMRSRRKSKSFVERREERGRGMKEDGGMRKKDGKKDLERQQKKSENRDKYV